MSSNATTPSLFDASSYPLGIERASQNSFPSVLGIPRPTRRSNTGDDAGAGNRQNCSGEALAYRLPWSMTVGAPKRAAGVVELVMFGNITFVPSDFVHEVPSTD
jgi:hypothetical protein